MAAESAARRLVDRRRVLRLRVQASRTGLLVLRADRERHRAQGERCGSQGDRKFFHQTVLLVCGRIVRVGEEHYDTATERWSMTCQPLTRDDFLSRPCVSTLRRLDRFSLGLGDHSAPSVVGQFE